MTRSIILVGGGGHCKSCIDVIERAGGNIAGIVDKKGAGSKVLDYDVIGEDAGLEELVKLNHLFLITVGQLKNPLPRINLFHKIKELGGELATVIAPSAIVSKYSVIGEGTIVMHGAFVNASAVVGSNCIINNKALIEHDAEVGDHSHVSTAAIVNGGCRLGKHVFVGSNAVLKNGISVADDVVIGTGAVVVNDISEAGTYVGNPAKRIGS